MKRKLIVTLVATALELYAATATAQVGSCTIAGTSKSAVAATPVTAGPLNPIDGFPEYVTDSTGLSLQRCLDPLVCFFDPIVAGDPFSLQIGSGGEAFYWAADVILNDQAGAAVFKLVMAAETAFLGDNAATGGPLDGTQFPFLRFRYVFDAPADGTYTLAHPYGTEKFDVVGATGNRDIFVSYDRGLTPGQTMTGNVGPFLQSFTQPVGFVGDTNLLDLVSGGPCGNTVTLTGVNSAGNPIDFGGGQTSLFTDLFAVQGMLYDGKVQTPINAPRLTYSRTAAAGGQIEAFAASTTAATVSVIDGPTIPVGSGRIPAAVTLDHADVTPLDATAAEGINSLAVGVTDASALPPVVTLTADDAVSLTTAGTRKFDPTSQNLKLVDFVDIASADFDPANNTLTVSASTGDKRANPALTVRGLGAINAATGLYTAVTLAPPAVVHVDSAAGGTSTAQVRVIAAVAPLAPSLPTVDFTTSTVVRLHWTDNSDNETGFRVYQVAATGARTLVATTTAGITTADVTTGLVAGTTYTFQVDSFNGIGAASSETVTTTTLALPAPASAPAFGFDTTVQRRLNVSWAASADATQYQILRRASPATAFTAIATVPASQLTYADLNGAANTTYTYQVVAQRVISGFTDSSAVVTSGSQTSVGNPTSSAITSITVVGNTVTVNFTDRSSNETGFQLNRATLNGTTLGAFAAVGGVVSPTNVAGTTTAMSTSDAGVPNGSYRYRVDVRNWANTAQSAVFPVAPASTTVLVATLNAPTNLSSVINGRPTVNWTDNSTGETGYRLLRRTTTVNATTGAVTDGTAVTTRNIAANLQTFREPTALANNLTLHYDVLAVNGTTLGASASVYALSTALPTPGNFTTANIAGGGIRLTWTATGTATVGGYEIQRCTGTACTNFTTLTTLNGRNTAAFNDTTATAVGTVYRYRMRALGGVGTGFVGTTFNAIATRTR